MAAIVNQPEIASNVIPEKGSLYLIDDFLPDFDGYSYKYIFDLSKLNEYDDDSGQNTNLTVNDFHLAIFYANSSSNRIWIKPLNDRILSGSKLEFVGDLKELNKEEFLGLLGYALIDNSSTARVLTEAKGPEIIFNFRNESLQKHEIGYTYSVEARSSINGSKVFIRFKDSDNQWHNYYDSRIYFSSDKEWKLLKWENMPYFHELEFVVDASQSPSLTTPKDFLIEQNYINLKTNNESEVIYNITLSNPHDCTIREMNVRDTFPSGIEYLSSKFLFSDDGKLGEPIETANPDGTRNLDWYIGDLSPDQSKTIQLFARNNSLSSDGPQKNIVRASGKRLGLIVSSESLRANIDIGELG